MPTEAAHQIAMQVAVTLILVRMGFIINRVIKETSKNPAVGQG